MTEDIFWRIHPNGGGHVHYCARVAASARVKSHAMVEAYAAVEACAVIQVGAAVMVRAVVQPHAMVGAGARIETRAVVGESVSVAAHAVVAEGAMVPAYHRVFVLSVVGSRNAPLSAYWCEADGSAGVEFVTGCFVGTGEMLLAECDETHGPDSPYTEDYRLAVELLARLVERQHKEVSGG